MYCNRCGAENADTDRFCRLCGTRISEGNEAASTAAALSVDKKTIRIDKKDFAPKSVGVRIHSCGYPLLPDMTVCPHCQQSVDDLQPDPTPASAPTPTPESVSKKTEVIDLRAAKATTIISKSDLATGRIPEPPRREVTDSATTQETAPTSEPETQVVDKRTINPYLKKKKPAPKGFEYYCSFQPIVREDEDTVPDKNVYDAQTVILNRQNTDPKNPSITSREQARLTFEDGVWYIEDLSSQGTTFVRVGRKTALQDGDIVLLGDREFEFSTQK